MIGGGEDGDYDAGDSGEHETCGGYNEVTVHDYGSYNSSHHPSERRVAARHAQSLFSLVFATLSGMTTTMVVMLMLAALRASSWP